MMRQETDKRNGLSLGVRQAIGLVVTCCFVVATICIISHVEKRLAEGYPLPDSTKIEVLNSQYPQYYQKSFTDRQYESSYKKETPVPLLMQPFNPNDADSMVLRQLGLTAWQAHSIIRYRTKGTFRRKNDLKRLSFMTDSMYLALEPYITLPDSLPRTEWKSTRDSLSVHFIEKSQEVREVNSADTTLLQTIPGIGSYKARQIVRYRQQLGGYYSKIQLQENKQIDLADSTLQYIIIDTTLIRPINVNHASVELLQQHPYISYTTAKKIYTLRRERFQLNAIDDLVDADILSPADANRLRPYLVFD